MHAASLGSISSTVQSLNLLFSWLPNLLLVVGVDEMAGLGSSGPWQAHI